MLHYLKKGFWILKHRPSHFFRLVRQHTLFVLSRTIRNIFPIPGVRLAPNVRLQKNRSLMAESPNAAISIGASSVLYEDSSVEAYGSSSVSIGHSAMIGGAKIVSRFGVTIGERFLASWNVFIQDFDPHPADAELRRAQIEDMVFKFKPSFDFVELSTLNLPEAPIGFKWEFSGAPISIGDDVWICAGATILKGANIGSGSVVATGAVVTRGDYPPNSLIAGNPAVMVKQFKKSN